MRLLLVRHAEPDYAHDSLTPKGWREAELLSRRLSRLKKRSTSMRSTSAKSATSLLQARETPAAVRAVTFRYRLSFTAKVLKFLPYSASKEASFTADLACTVKV